ncbi:hypothetical protein ACWGJ2_27530 [Streptomyces sp. NPDC054796]
MADSPDTRTSTEHIEEGRRSLPLLGACGCGPGCGCGCQSGGPCQCGGCCG